MDLFFCGRTRISYLFPKACKFPFRSQSLIYKHPEITVCRQLQYLEKQPDYCYPSSNSRILGFLHDQKFKNHIHAHKINTVHYATSPKTEPCENKDCYAPPPAAKPTLFQKMKEMYKKYWYVLIPVHLVTSIGWISLFYLSAKNGVDIVGMLEALNLSERYLDMLRGSNAGHWAVAYAVYKIFTPLRYTVTLGGTTMTVRLLNRWGYIKNKPSPELERSIKCAEEHRSAIKKSSLSSKSNQIQSDKT